MYYVSLTNTLLYSKLNFIRKKLFNFLNLISQNLGLYILFDQNLQTLIRLFTDKQSYKTDIYFHYAFLNVNKHCKY